MEVTLENIRKVVREEITAVENERLLSGKEAAKFIGISFNTLKIWVESSRIPFYTIGEMKRYRKADLLKAAEFKYSRNN
jgi:excisionase family DNA binding protein